MLKLPVYLDNNATTPCEPRVVEAMVPYFTENFGNAASRNHPFGWAAEEAVDYAREQVAKLVGADPKEIIFTSGATEADNLAIKGVFEMYATKGNHIITATTEHKAVLDTCKHIEKQGGGHERGMRSGTLNVPGIVGFGKAAELARLEMEQDAKRLSGLRDKLESELLKLEEAYVNGNREHRLPHVTNISFKHVEGEGLL